MKKQAKYFGFVDKDPVLKMAEKVVLAEQSEQERYGKSRSYKDEFYKDGKLVKEIIRYGEVNHSTIIEIFGHLMYYDDLKKIAGFPDETTYLTAKYEWDEKECYFTVFQNTDNTEEYHNGCVFFEGRKFERNSMGMEPFITLSQIECELEAAEESEEEVSSAEPSEPPTPKTESPAYCSCRGMCFGCGGYQNEGTRLVYRFWVHCVRTHWYCDECYSKMNEAIKERSWCGNCEFCNFGDNSEAREAFQKALEAAKEAQENV